MLMEITESWPFSTTVDIAPPEGFVRGSLRISVSVVGKSLCMCVCVWGGGGGYG